MISVSGKTWKEKKVNKNLVEKLQQDHNFSPTVSRLIISRKFDEKETFSINNDVKLTNVFIKNKDYLKSLEVITLSLKQKEKICIVGDYDVDGSVASSLLSVFFKQIKHPYFCYIPDRVKDGYGATLSLFKKLISKKPKLVIMVDCGSTSIDAIEFLNKKSIKSIIIDHHEITKPFPSANSIINPKKNNGYEEYNYLCASSLTYFLVDMLKKKLNIKFNDHNFLIYTLLATICDVMPLRKLNRTIAIEALNKFDLNKCNVFKKIFELLKKNNKLTINDLGFIIGPILNSGGRLGNPNMSTQLLCTDKNDEIEKISKKLIFLNEKRKLIENKILSEFNFNEIEKKFKDIIIIFKPNINEGLIGIIAARLKEYFNKPSIVITNSNNLLKGSARSISNFNIGIIIKNAVNNNLVINGGGHQMAGGFTLDQKNLKSFIKFVNYSYKKFVKEENLLNYDSKISSSAFTKKFYNEISLLEPFGNQNQEPTFFFENLKVIKSHIIKNKHISSILKSETGYSINAISFNSFNTKIGDHLVNYKKNLNVIGQIKQNFWNNKNTIQLTVKDLII